VSAGGENAALLKTLVEVSLEKISATGGGKKVKISRLRALISRLYTDALLGDAKAREQLLRLLALADLAAVDDLVNEPLRIIVTGGLPD
jgi:hypothetical protein